MIYSKWKPSVGGYDYYDVPAMQVGLGDDLPTPRHVSETKLGIPSTEAGREIPSGAKRVGSGPLAKGLIAPLDRSGLLSGVGLDTATLTSPPVLLVAALAALAGWFFGRKTK